MTNESIRQAVKEFTAKPGMFSKDPRGKAEAKWGRIADWDVSGVTSMKELLEYAKEFSEDVGLWDVCESMQEMFWVRLPRAPCTEWSLPAHRRISR